MTQPSGQAPDVKRVPDVDLGGIFGNRTEGLTGLAPRRRSVESETQAPPREAGRAVSLGQADEAPRAVGAEEVGQTTAEPRPSSPPRKRPAKVTGIAKEPEGAGNVRLVIVQLPDRIADRLRDSARARGVTYKELILDAVEASIDHLGDLIAQRRPPAREAGSLFAGERTSPLPRPEGRRQVSLKLTEGSIAALDGLATDHGAGSRSELVATALDAYLSGQKDDQGNV